MSVEREDGKPVKEEPVLLLAMGGEGVGNCLHVGSKEGSEDLDEFLRLEPLRERAGVLIREPLTLLGVESQAKLLELSFNELNAGFHVCWVVSLECDVIKVSKDFDLGEHLLGGCERWLDGDGEEQPSEDVTLTGSTL